MKYIVPSPEAEFPETFKSIWMAGPQTGLDSAGVLLSRCPPGHHGPKTHVHPVDQFYFVLKGTTNVQIGTDVFEVGPNTLVHFPAGVPHCNWNSSDDHEMHLELFVPAPPPPGPELLQYVEPRKVENAAQYIHRLRDDGYPDRPFASQQLVRRENGSQHVRIYAARVRPGGKGPSLHFHEFDQLYFILKGSFDIDIGFRTSRAPTHSLVVLPAGILHTNRNDSAEDEIHLTMLVPEPADGKQLDYKVDIRFENA